MNIEAMKLKTSVTPRPYLTFTSLKGRYFSAYDEGILSESHLATSPCRQSTSTPVSTQASAMALRERIGPSGEIPTRGKRSMNQRLLIYLLVVLVLFCLCWIVWIAALTIAPSETTNVVMNTSSLDSGDFWRFSRAPRQMIGVGLAGLGVVGFGYIVVLWKLVQLINTSTGARMSTSIAARSDAKVHDYATKLKAIFQSQVNATGNRWTRKIAGQATSVAVNYLSEESYSHRRMQMIIKVTDLAIQCAFLVQLLEQGMPISLLVVFALIVASNALTSAILVILPHDNVGGLQVLVDTFFNVMVAIAFPVLVLVYTLNAFTFDQRLMDINYKSFPFGYFERYAAVVANPVEVENVRNVLDSLRIDSVLKIFTRVSTHFSLNRRLFHLANLLRTAGLQSHASVYPKQQRALAALFCAIAVAVVVYTVGSIRSTGRACQQHPECVQIARHWVVGLKDNEFSRCPCLTLIDRNVTIATYSEWMSPLNRTEKVAQLAAAGYLQTLQLVNRGLSFFPEELRRCHNLRHVSLFYTDTLGMPEWFGDFTFLEFFHFQGKTLDKSIQHLPDHVFERLPMLSYIHLAMLPISKFPPLNGLAGLRSLTLAVLPFITEIPGFEYLRDLERLTVAALTSAQVFPDLSHVRNLKSLVVADRGAFCCNGFLGSDKCNLNHSLCRVQPIWGTPAITQCIETDRVATPKTRAYFDKFNYSACNGEALQPGQLKLAPTPDEMIQCNGTMYRKCQVPGYDGPAMCYNARWMAVACDPSPFAIEMRRLQIAQGVGEPCSSENEAWLGCGQ